MPCFDIYLWSLKTRRGGLSLWLKSEAPLWHFGLKYIKMRYLGKKNYPSAGDGLVPWLGEVGSYWQKQLKKGRCHPGPHFKGLNFIMVKKNGGNIRRTAGHITLEIRKQRAMKATTRLDLVFLFHRRWHGVHSLQTDLPHSFKQRFIASVMLEWVKLTTLSISFNLVSLTLWIWLYRWYS